MDSAAHGRPPGSRMTSVYHCCWSKAQAEVWSLNMFSFNCPIFIQLSHISPVDGMFGKTTQCPNLREIIFLFIFQMIWWEIKKTKIQQGLVTQHSFISVFAVPALPLRLSCSIFHHYICASTSRRLSFIFLCVWLQRAQSVYLPSSAAPTPLTVCLKHTSNQSEAFDRGSLQFLCLSSGSSSFHL